MRSMAVVAVVLVVVLAVIGISGGSGPRSERFGATDRVVLVSVPGLRWQDLVATDTPALDEVLLHTALLSVRSIGPETSLLEAYLTLGAGNRVTSSDDVAAEVADGRCVPGVLADARGNADDDLNGAEPGALGERLRELGVPTAVYGGAAAIAMLMDADGCVGTYAAEVPGTLADEIPAGVTLVELGGLETTDVAAERAAALQRIDREIAALPFDGSGSGALVVVLAPVAPFDRAEVTVVGVRRPTPSDGSTGSLVSPTTRRADYATLTDVAPAVLAAVDPAADPAADPAVSDDVEVVLPDSMNGTEMRATAAPAGDPSAQEAALADLAERVVLRDRAVGPVSVLLVVCVVFCAVAALAGRGRAARTLAPIVAAYPTVTFLSGLVAYHQLPLGFVVVMTLCVSAVLGWLAVGLCSRWGAWAPVGALIGVLWVVMVVDVCTGGRLQINTPLGYTPTVAGRFQGFGNLSFGLVGAAAVVTSVLTLQRATSGRPTVVAPVWVAAFVGAVTTVAVAAPAFGSDVGGTLAVLPSFAVLIALMSGRRISWQRLGLVGLATVVTVATLAFVDRARAADSRTHLGRFLDELLAGDGWLIIRRKLRANVAIFTSSFWSFVLVGVLVVLAVVAWRHRESVLPAVRRRPALRVFLAGLATVAVLGFALNDSGLAVPSIMLAVVVPWLVATLVVVVPRAGR